MPPVKKACGLLFVSVLLSVAPLRGVCFAGEEMQRTDLRLYPPQRAGSRTGTAEAERNYFQNCVVHNGDVEAPVPLPVPAPANSLR